MTQKASVANPNPEPPSILALDVGTSSTRTLLFDAAGNTLPNVLAQRPYQLRITNEGEVSVDPDALVAVVDRTINDALEMAGPLATHIGAVALDTFWHSLMGADADNRPLTPLILWEDTRPQDAAVCDQAQRILKVLGLSNAFDFIASRDDVEHGKPDPEIYSLLARELEVQPEDFLVIEDSPARVKAALAAGMNVVAVSTPLTRQRLHESGLLPPQQIVDNPKLLPTVAAHVLAHHQHHQMKS